MNEDKTFEIVYWAFLLQNKLTWKIDTTGGVNQFNSELNQNKMGPKLLPYDKN